MKYKPNTGNKWKKSKHLETKQHATKNQLINKEIKEEDKNDLKWMEMDI